VTFTTRDSLAVDRYADVPATGAFILIDETTHQTAAAGMLR
jgi:sulfate adenylyltransferase subunit 1